MHGDGDNSEPTDEHTNDRSNGPLDARAHGDTDTDGRAYASADSAP